MNIQQALEQAKSLLETASVDKEDVKKPSPGSSADASLDAMVLLGHTLRCNTAHIVAWPEKELDLHQQELYLDLVERRARGTPIAHLTGQREFWSLELETDASTLIPRPETETLVEFILEHFQGHEKLSLLDMGTGTGAIAIAIASEKPGWSVTGCDISDAAIRLAIRNSQKYKLTNTRFIQSDWYQNFGSSRFDIIVSNPPYIAEDDPHLQLGDVRFEPHTALTSGKSGMDDIEFLCRHARSYLKHDGWLIIEHGYDQQRKVSDCFMQNSLTDIVTRKDLSGHTRMTAGKI